MWAIDTSHRTVQIMHASILVGVSKVVLINNTHEPVRAPCVFRKHGGPVSFVLLDWLHFSVDLLHVVPSEQGLQFRAEAVSFFDADLGFHHMNVGVDNAFVVGGDGRGQRVEVKVEVGVFGLEPLRKLTANV